jgi:putative DNA primase/helicase
MAIHDDNDPNKGGSTGKDRPPLLADVTMHSPDSESQSPEDHGVPLAVSDGLDLPSGDGSTPPVKLELIRGGGTEPDPLDPLRALRPDSLAGDINQAVRAWAAAVVGRPKIEQVSQTVLASRVLRKLGVTSAKALLSAGLREAEDKAGLEPPAEIAGPVPGFCRPNPAPSSQAVDGAKLFAEIEQTLRRYVVVEKYAYVILSFWIGLTYLFDCFDVCPLLFLRSPVRRCGKTRLLDVLFCLASRPLGTSNITASGMFRAIDVEKPTLLVDELDSFGPHRSEVRNIINAGHHRAHAWVIRAAGRHDVYCPKAVAAIGALHPTIVDRSLVIQMKRKGPGDSVEGLKLTELLAMTEPVRQRLVRWSQDNNGAVSSIIPSVPMEVESDRARDNAMPLIAIAMVAGGDWPERVREAVIALSSMADQDAEGDPAEILLKDLARIFDAYKTEQLDTQVILRELAAQEDSLWATYSHGRPITREQLARLLRPFGVTPVKWMDKARPRKAHRGYALAHLRDAFVRYAGWNPPHSPQPPQPVG